MSARDVVLDMLRTAAREGRRCPTNPELRDALHKQGLGLSVSAIPPALARDGLLRIEVYSKNWRVVEVDGFRTAEDPRGGEPYKVIEKETP